MKALVLGIGDHRGGDDCAGLAVADAVAAAGMEGVAVRRWTGGPSGLLDPCDIADADVAIVVDAMRTGARPGTVRRFGHPPEGLPALRDPSGAAGVGGGLLSAGDELGRLPGRVVVYGIEVGRCAPGAGLSPAVASAIGAAAAEVLAELRQAEAGG